MYRSSKETLAKKDRNMRHLVSTASRIFSERGYSGTTIRDIVREAGSSTGNFYFYFKDKESLFTQLYDEFSELLDRVSDFALNKEGMNDVMGFCRSKTSEIWIFQQNRGLARAMMIEAAGLNPVFEKKRAEIYEKSNLRIERIFEALKAHGFPTSLDAKTCALICNGTLYYVINDWLHCDSGKALTDYAFPIIIYNLNAFRLEYREKQVLDYIDEMLLEMETNFKG